MNITKLQQSGFILETDTGFKLGIDIGDKTPIEELKNTRVAACVISHVHGDHFSVPQIKALSPKKLWKLIMP